ncbi:unnamed protein product [Paramecium sonneborni]|uniref:EGF-like domain-containing protein n=1 Tax=Paramecium sonneborni TaxID=65129 RepID=A0A8S1PSW8_9CILI|nr:unnamed protein product [Paramecium sonneborni]
MFKLSKYKISLERENRYEYIGGQECLQCPSNCINCDSTNPSKCTNCGDQEITHRILDSNNVCVCAEGYFEVWYTYNCQNIQFNLSILQFSYILSLEQYVNRLQDKYSYSSITIQGLNYMVNSGVVKDDIHQFQYISQLESNKIINPNTQYPQGQAYKQQFNNMFALGIKLTHDYQVFWAANVNSSNYQMYKGTRLINTNTWKFVIYQFQLNNYIGNVFLQIALTENGDVQPQTQNRILEIADGNMVLLYYLAYEHNYFLIDSELDLIINDILYIQFQRPLNSLDYQFNGNTIIIETCQPPYILKNQQCICDNQNGYYLYYGICQSQCPSDCLTCTKEVCLLSDHSIRCQEGYYLDTEKKVCLQCQIRCKTCINGKDCITCKQQFILHNTQCFTCQEFQTLFMCDQYDHNCQCTKCNDGYQLDIIHQCIQCPNKCLSCNFQDICIICEDGYYLHNNQCIKCQENCFQCQEQDYCIKCQIGYHIYNGIVSQCTNICINYLDQCLCKDCPIQYYRNDDDFYCYSCQQPCLTCSNKETCIDCISNHFYLDNFQCKQCQSPCLTCLTQTKCLSCINEQYYYMKEEFKCIKCPIPCTTCYLDESLLCVGCLEKFYLYNYQCYECPLYCQDTCYYDIIHKLIQCDLCQVGFYPSKINKPFECINCPNYCTNCTNEQTCLECTFPYILQNGKCQQCNELFGSYCISCNQLNCVHCQNGYQLIDGKCVEDIINVTPLCLLQREFYNTLSNSCDKCLQYCLICKELKTCIICEEKSYKKSEICINCKFPCNNCMSDQFCLTISNQLYYIDYSITDINEINAFKCNSPCKNCKSFEECIDCLDGYYFYNNQCLLCDPSCKTCKNKSDFCTSCYPGFQLSNGKCPQCIDQNCQSCRQYCSLCNHLLDDLYICKTCLPGYYLIDQECHPCSSNCKTCSIKSDQCTSCFEGYFLTPDMKCEKCNQGCQSCQVQTKSCTICEYGYQLIQQKDFLYECVKCDQGCNSCNEGRCLVCSNQQFLTEDGKCEKCVAPCFTCSSLTQCIICADGYYMNNEKCDKCSDNCSKCSSLNDCITCIEPFKLIQKQCIKCQENCITCTNNQCQQCKQGYTLQNDGQCQQIPIICNINSCSQCLNENQCQICQQGYIINTTLDQCEIENQIQNQELIDESDSQMQFIIIILSIATTIISFIIIYLIQKCRKLYIVMKRFVRENPKFPDLPFTKSQIPSDNSN